MCSLVRVCQRLESRVDMALNGKLVKAVAQVSKQGLVYVVDRVTGNGPSRSQWCLSRDIQMADNRPSVPNCRAGVSAGSSGDEVTYAS